MKKIITYSLKLLVLLSLFVLLSNAWVIVTTKSALREDIGLLERKQVALVPGTSKYTMDGNPNGFFEGRIRAAVALYNAGKVKHILVSGDNRSVYYNEPRDMKEALMALGVPAEDITLDFAGLRTLDSIVRCKEIFGQSDITIVTQRFHSYRALFIAGKAEMDAVAFIADDPDFPFLNVFIREWVARSLAVIDLYVLNKGPRHLGDKEPISIP